MVLKVVSLVWTFPFAFALEVPSALMLQAFLSLVGLVPAFLRLLYASVPLSLCVPFLPSLFVSVPSPSIDLFLPLVADAFLHLYANVLLPFGVSLPLSLTALAPFSDVLPLAFSPFQLELVLLRLGAEPPLPTSLLLFVF